MPVDMNMTILVVDDSGTMRLMFKQYLNKAGFSNIFMAVDGRDAVKKLEEGGKIDLIVSDWNMPNMDGLALLKWVRNNPVFKNLPFIMATAQGDKTQQHVVLENGGNNHIAKPFDSEEIKKKIVEVFEGVTEKHTEKRVPEIINGKVSLKIAHIQITDHLILGVLKHQIKTGQVIPKHFTLETECIGGWNPIQEKLETAAVDGAFVLAPIAMDLFAFDVPIKLVLFAHKNGSGFIRNKNYETEPSDSLKDFYKYKIINIPHKMSIHNMLAHKFLTGLGLKPGVPGKKAIDVRFEVVPPIKMPGIMKENEDVGGFIVAEPICTKTIASGIGEMEFISATLWKDHPCCVVALRDEIVEAYPDAVYELTDLLVKAGQFVDSNKEKAAEIAVNFLDPDKTIGLSTPVLTKVLTQHGGITMNDLYPIKQDLDKIQQYMFHQMDIGKLIDMDRFVDLRFANKSC
jgi:CheY-like chemotaxis protein